jgi:hypothetical protein
MSFTYVLTTDIGKVRLELGDTTVGNGILPGGENLRDEEINLYLTQNGNDVNLTVGALASVLARRWATVSDVSVGPRSESLSQISKAWERQAASLAGGDAGTAFSIAPVRVDGYTDNGDEYSRGVYPYGT